MKRKGKIMYIGKVLSRTNSVLHKYCELDSKDEMSSTWSFSNSLFKKGTIGSIYNCSFKDDIISYSKNEIPTSFILQKNVHVSTNIVFPILNKYEEETRQLEILIKNSKKGQNEIDFEIEEIKRLYKLLKSTSQKSSFIGNLIYKITK